MKLSEVVPEVIALAQAASDYWERELPKRYKHYPHMEEGEEDGPPPPEQVRLKELLASMPEEWLYTIMAVVHLCTRALRVEQLPAHVKKLKREWRPGSLPLALSDRVTLAGDLSDGLERLAADGLTIDGVAQQLAGAPA